MANIQNQSIESIYIIYRDYIKHEDSLVNSRTTALITIQSFVLATFGLCYQERYKMALNVIDKSEYTLLGPIAIEYNGFLLALGLVGLATSVIGLLSIHCAHKAISHLEESWKAIAAENPTEHLPGLTGGGKASVTIGGSHFSIFTPIFLILFWLATELFLLFAFGVFKLLETHTLLELLQNLAAMFR